MFVIAASPLSAAEANCRWKANTLDACLPKLSNQCLLLKEDRAWLDAATMGLFLQKMRFRSIRFVRETQTGVYDSCCSPDLLLRLRWALLAKDGKRAIERCTIGTRCFIPILRINLFQEKQLRSARFVLTKELGLVCFLSKQRQLSTPVRYAVQAEGGVFFNGIRCDQCRRKWSNGLIRCHGCHKQHYCSDSCRRKHYYAHVRGQKCRKPQLPTIKEETAEAP